MDTIEHRHASVERIRISECSVRSIPLCFSRSTGKFCSTSSAILFPFASISSTSIILQFSKASTQWHGLLKSPSAHKKQKQMKTDYCPYGLGLGNVSKDVIIAYTCITTSAATISQSTSTTAVAQLVHVNCCKSAFCVLDDIKTSYIPPPKGGCGL